MRGGAIEQAPYPVLDPHQGRTLQLGLLWLHFSKEDAAMEKDTGGWLSAQQAVLPDGTELTNLPLVNKKLPPLVREEQASEPVAPDAKQVCDTP